MKCASCGAWPGHLLLGHHLISSSYLKNVFAVLCLLSLLCLFFFCFLFFMFFFSLVSSLCFHLVQVLHRGGVVLAWKLARAPVHLTLQPSTDPPVGILTHPVRCVPDEPRLAAIAVIRAFSKFEAIWVWLARTLWPHLPSCDMHVQFVAPTTMRELRYLDGRRGTREIEYKADDEYVTEMFNAANFQDMSHFGTSRCRLSTAARLDQAEAGGSRFV